MDVTASLLADAASHARECPRSAYAARVVKAAAAKKADGEVWEILKKDSDRTMGYISNALSYSKFFTTPKFHAAVVRLIKGGFVSIEKVSSAPVPGTRAHKETPFADCFYRLVLKD